MEPCREIIYRCMLMSNSRAPADLIYDGRSYTRVVYCHTHTNWKGLLLMNDICILYIERRLITNATRADQMDACTWSRKGVS